MNPRFLVAAIVLIAGACSDDDGGPILAPTPPIAFVRYVHVVPDTTSMDWRPIDAVDNSPAALNLQFRANTPYQAMGAGPRRLRVFPTSENINITSQVVIDTTITFTANSYYTLIHIGLARPGQAPPDRIWVLEDALPGAIGANQIALRVVNAGVGLGAVDIETAGTTTGPFTSQAANVAYGAATPYALVPTGARALRASAAGTTTNVAAAVAVPVGAAPANGQSAEAGTSVAGSVITAIVVPRSVAGSGAPAAFTTPAILYLQDRAPVR